MAVPHEIFHRRHDNQRGQAVGDRYQRHAAPAHVRRKQLIFVALQDYRHDAHADAGDRAADDDALGRAREERDAAGAYEKAEEAGAYDLFVAYEARRERHERAQKEGNAVADAHHEAAERPDLRADSL